MLREDTIAELGDYSDEITSRNLKKRYQSGRSGLHLASATANLTEDYLETVFVADSTYGGEAIPHTVGPRLGASQKYSLVLRFYGVEPILTMGFKEADESLKEDLIRKVIEECDVRFHSDDPSFLWCGVWENLSKLNLAIYKFRGTKGNGVWQQRHKDAGAGDAYLTKHLVQLLDELDDWVPYVAKLVKTKGLRKARRRR